jgi:hypothetical protein
MTRDSTIYLDSSLRACRTSSSACNEHKLEYGRNETWCSCLLWRSGEEAAARPRGLFLAAGLSSADTAFPKIS